ncbi:hypothetical protein TELCIR_04930 [Teladorsagia circumcincta]|uniref:DUF7083 domain-containing protein n=1 Tax=Teladorsagia circumcincta TaxID=45464 RepID=A0A2G9UTN9_TELCI|nr:hypothetical protein TELCIR_04930 [Teladorsagia circumcincta]
MLIALPDALKGIVQHQLPQSTSHAAEPTKLFDVLAGRIAKFTHDPAADLTFEAWYRRHQDIFTEDAQMLDDSTRVRLLLHELDAAAYGEYSNYILPKTQRDITFVEAVSTLMNLFGPQQSLFSQRYACMKLTKNPDDDYVTYAGQVNCECKKFKLSQCDENQFKCLIFLDTAADITIINEATWSLMSKHQLLPSSLIAQSASGNRIQFLGQRECTYSFDSKSAQGVFYVGRTQLNLLGAEWILKLGIFAS